MPPLTVTRVVAFADGVDDGALGIELLALLVEVGDLHVGAVRTVAAVGRQLAEQQPQQRRLAGAVGTDEPDAIAAHDAGGEVADDAAAAEGLRHRIGLEHHLAAGLGRLDLQPHGADLRAAGGALGAHRHQRAHAALVAGAPGLDALPQPHLFLGQLLVELLVGDRLVGQPLFLLAQERRVVARPRREAAAIELDDPRGQPLEERAVVGDEEHRAGVVGQERLEPVDGVDVEVVGRLVEQQQRRAAPPAPAPAARAGASRPTAC